MKTLLIFAMLSVCLAKKSLDGYRVFRINPKTQEHIKILNRLQYVYQIFDFWSAVSKPNVPVDVMLPPEYQAQFQLYFNAEGMDVQELIKDVGRLTLNETIGDFKARSKMTWNSYYSLDDIHAWMDSLAIKYPKIVSIISAGKSFEKNDIKGLKISFKPGKRSVFLEGGMHAREWISPATVTYIANEILTSKDLRFRKIAESFDWYIFPNVNPDGYIYTHKSYRLWRKTRTSYGYCAGADPNRNWNYQWGAQGTSDKKCSDIYKGPKPFSEKATYALSRFIDTIGSTIDVYLAFHSYSQLLLIPYGHTYEHLDNYDDVYAIGLKAAEALAKRYGTKYKVGDVAGTIYPASGSSMDWVKNKYKIPIVFTYELRDNGNKGFLLPANQIQPNCEEVMDSIVAMFEESEKLGYFKLGDSNKKQ